MSPQQAAQIYFNLVQTLIDELWLTFTVIMTVLLLLGRSMLEIGSLKSKVSRHIATKNIFQLVITCICFFAVGHALSTEAFGGFYGSEQYLTIGYTRADFSNWALMFLACWHCVSIASCSLAERTRTSIHNALAVLISCCLFPVVASWTWGGGWLS